MKTIFEEALLKLSVILEELDIGYAIIGAIASGIYGLPRTTYDIDTLLSLEKVKIPVFLQRLKERGFIFEEEKILEELKEGYFTAVWYQNMRIDIILSILPYFKQVIERSASFNLLDKEMKFAQPEDLIVLKLISNREHDREDINTIKEICSLDIGYIKDSLRRLVGEANPSFLVFQKIFEG